ncbi:hypothetical protein [Eubacterium oxidoreducens]|uniref:Uncharacterized protein n=1 Tax=Eubacterium oxidoreducens TaxID=1732 RepID=A0A1G6BTI4_EUBOX|nr:hypothetical protein [Eubacterium oxidoreducens]SDB23915.1 hypothetical protein SAMN02910417_01795 [Eubacterium oxidoreducens]
MDNQQILTKIEEALQVATTAKYNAATLYDVSDTRASSFAQDTFMYFDTNDLQGEIQTLRLLIDNLKRILIDIKTHNDHLLLHGGFLPCVDKQIADMFLSTSLCKLLATDQKTVTILDEIIQKINILKKDVEATI